MRSIVEPLDESRLRFEAVFLDLDGVLADFPGAVIDLFGANSERIFSNWPEGCYNIESVLGIDAKEMWDRICSKGSPFWRDMARYEWAAPLCEACSRHGDIVFLSCPTRDPSCLEGKLGWLHDLTGDWTMRNFIFTPMKHFLAAPGRVLIDDNGENCAKFEAAGGKAIRFPQPWNGNHTTRKLEFVEDALRRMAKEI